MTGHMGATRRHKQRRPVISRLTVAWYSAFGLLIFLGGVFAIYATSDKGHGRIALAVNGIERFARPAPIINKEPTSTTGQNGLRLSAPNLRDGGAMTDPGALSPEGEEVNDILFYPEEFDLAENSDDDLSPDDIIITIDGNLQGATAVSNASLTAAPIAIPDPDPALLRSTPLGKIPRIATDGRKAFNEYARPFNNPDNAPRIAIVVGGLGLNPALTERAIDELPPEISLAFAPYAKDLKFWTTKARKSGHEVLIELPMEGYGGNEQTLGAAALLTTRSPKENLQRLDWLLARFGGYFAATNYMGAKLSSDTDAFAPILEKLKNAGVAYIDDTGAARAAGQTTGTRWVTVNRSIPPAPDESGRRTVRRELKALEQIAKRDGAALGKTYAYATTLDELVTWTNSLDAKGLISAPASSVLQTRTASR